MKILITGARGQLGQAFQKVFLDHEIIATDFETLDITRLDDIRKFLEKNPVDWVFNAAAYNLVDQAEADPEAPLQANVVGPRNLAIASHEKNIPFLHVSSDYVFDGLAGRPYTEEDKPNPLSVYGKSKWNGEKEVAANNPKHLIVRTAWLYSVTGKNFPKTMIRLGLKGDVRVVDDQYGSPTYAPHLAAGIRQLIEAKAWGTYHLAGSGEASWHSFAHFIFQSLKLPSTVQAIASKDFPRPAPRPPYAVLTTCREPKVELPPWQEGAKAFALEIEPLMEELRA